MISCMLIAKNLSILFTVYYKDECISYTEYNAFPP